MVGRSTRMLVQISLIDSIVKSANWMATPNNNVIPIGDTVNNVSMLKDGLDIKVRFKLGTESFPYWRFTNTEYTP